MSLVVMDEWEFSDEEFKEMEKFEEQEVMQFVSERLWQLIEDDKSLSQRELRRAYLEWKQAREEAWKSIEDNRVMMLLDRQNESLFRETVTKWKKRYENVLKWLHWKKGINKIEIVREGKWDIVVKYYKEDKLVKIKMNFERDKKILDKYILE